jgi:hypothetical protein
VHTVSLTAGQTGGGYDFGNFRLGTISGTVFGDLDADGDLNGDEIGLAGRTVYIDANDNGSLDEGEVSTVTGENGAYRFTDLGPGTYHVRTVQPLGFGGTGPAGGVQMISLTSGLDAGQRNFGSRNLPPSAADDAYSLDEDSILTVPAASGILNNDSDPGSDPLSAALVEGPAHGTLDLNANGGFTYTPAADFNGTDSFSYRASDGLSTSGVATVRLTILPVQDRPVARADAYSVAEDGVLEVAAPGLLGNDGDVDGDALKAVLVTGPAHGLLDLHADGSFTYTPAGDFNGADSFTYQAEDDAGASEPVTVRIDVTPVNDPPRAIDDAYQLAEDAVLTVSAAEGVLANDVDVDGPELTVVLVDAPQHGLLVLGADGAFTYTPDPDFHGSDSFTYRATDGFGTSGLATVSLVITPVNDDPTIDPKNRS